jgi:hypothetical protein
VLSFALALLVAQLEVAPEQHLNRARVCMGALDFDCAERALVRVRSSLDLLTPELAREALSFSAEVALSTSRFEEAEQHLLELLLRDPGFKPDQSAWPPRWLAVLEAAKARVPDQDPPRIRVESPGDRLIAGREVVVRAFIEDPSGVERAVLHLEPNVKIAMTSTGGPYLGVIAGDRVRPPELRFRVTAYDRYGHGPGRSRTLVSSVVEPMAAPPPPPPPDDPVTSTWWFWTIIGAAVAGAAATTAAVVLAPEAGTVTERLQWP